VGIPVIEADKRGSTPAFHARHIQLTYKHFRNTSTPTPFKQILYYPVSSTMGTRAERHDIPLRAKDLNHDRYCYRLTQGKKE